MKTRKSVPMIIAYLIMNLTVAILTVKVLESAFCFTMPLILYIPFYAFTIFITPIVLVIMMIKIFFGI